MHVDERYARLQLRPSVLHTQEQHILNRYGFDQLAVWQDWLKQYQTYPETFDNPILELIRLEGLTNGTRWWSRVSNTIAPEHHFLLDAIRLAEFYPVLQSELEHSSMQDSQTPPAKQTWALLLKDWCKAKGLLTYSNPAQLAFELDFSDPDEFLSALLLRNRNCSAGE